MSHLDNEDPRGGAPVCRLLRTKTAFGTTAEGHDWQSGSSSTAAYWCLGTMQTAGPDDALVHPTTCLSGRRCFEPPIV
jgi:hypothetical protein